MSEFPMIARHRALALLDECTGDTIWPVDICRDKRVPEQWIVELADAIESNPAVDREMIYVEAESTSPPTGENPLRPTNQFHGIRDVDLAMKLGEALGINVTSIRNRSLTRSALVAAIKEEVFEM